MKLYFKFISLLCIAGLSSCTLSLNPLYNTTNTIADDRVIGIWHEVELPDSVMSKLEPDFYSLDNEDQIKILNKYKTQFIWNIKRVEGQDKEYVASRGEGEAEYSFQAFIVDINGQYFVDLYPKSSPTENELFNDHLMPLHSFTRLTIDTDFMICEIYAPDIKERNLQYVESEDNRSVLITDSNKVLVEIIEEASKTNDDFISPIFLLKKY